MRRRIALPQLSTAGSGHSSSVVSGKGSYMSKDGSGGSIELSQASAGGPDGC